MVVMSSEANPSWKHGEEDEEGKIPVETHLGTQYQCSKCGLMAGTEISYWYHWRCAHAEKASIAERICPYCSKNCQGIVLYRRHLLNYHGGYRFRCPACQKTFADADYFKDHLKYHKKTGTTRAFLDKRGSRFGSKKGPVEM
jgi:endogenous inhibitor of DNA gyrase (YacG/DUF329 family)